VAESSERSEVSPGCALSLQFFERGHGTNRIQRADAKPVSASQVSARPASTGEAQGPVISACDAPIGKRSGRSARVLSPG
jgi:hypothetical protein